MFENSNSQTQPLKPMPVFNNWEVIVEGWYCVGKVSELSDKHPTPVKIGSQELVLFKTQNGDVACLDAFCSHMGLRLSTGEVVNDKLRCKFHHWHYDKSGSVYDAGCTKLEQKKQNSYPVTIRYGLIWIWAGKEAAYSLPYHPELHDGEYEYKIGTLYSRPSHPHISLLNALDLQHVNTVHALSLKVEASHHEAEDKSYIHYDFSGTFFEKRQKFLSGGGYKYSVRYSGSTIGFLKALEGIRLFGKVPFPPIYATFGYRQTSERKTFIQPVFLAPKRKGLIGMLKTRAQLLMTQIIYNRLKNEDGAIYENIRFTPNFTEADANIITFVAHVNRLKPSLFTGVK